MSQRTISPVFDGAQGPILRFPVRDGAGYRDLASAAVEVYIEDRSGNSLGMRPGHIVQAKNTGQVDVMLKGRETDFEGLGSEIVLVPRFYFPETMAGSGAAAANLLANASFDTDANVDGVADSWSLQGAKTATWAVQQNDPAPPAIFGNVQLVKHATIAEPDFIQQVLAPAMVAGDVLSVGCWHRSSGGAGEAQGDGHALFYRLGAGSNAYSRLRVGDNDWYFQTGSLVADTVYSAATFGIDLRGTTLSNRLDEAFAFLGRWYLFHGERISLPVRPCARPAKSTNQIAGVGSFEQDSDGDGFPDAWSNQASGVTFSIERNPANVSEGRAALKVVVADPSAKLIRLIWRRKFKSGDTWRMRAAVKTVGALSAGAGTGGFTVALSTEQFDGPAQSATGNLPTNAAVFTDATATLALTAERSALVLDINLNGYTGTLYLDDVRLDCTVAAP